MNKELTIDEARSWFASEIRKSEYIPADAEITLRVDPGGIATAFYCYWRLEASNVRPGSFARGITVKVGSGAINNFRAASPEERGRMLDKFHGIFDPLVEVQYRPDELRDQPFVINIDEHDLD